MDEDPPAPRDAIGLCFTFELYFVLPKVCKCRHQAGFEAAEHPDCFNVLTSEMDQCVLRCISKSGNCVLQSHVRAIFQFRGKMIVIVECSARAM